MGKVHDETRRQRITGLLALLCCLGCVAVLTACGANRVIPKELARQVDRSVHFNQIHDSPSGSEGRLVALGGEVLSAKRTKEGTEIEVLQLPLDRSERPAPNRTRSQGRFIAVQREPLDPATLAPGTPVTIVGEVRGARRQQLDETDYQYPVLEVRHLTVFDEQAYQNQRYARPGVSVYGGGGYGGWGGGMGGIGIGLGF